MIGKKYIVSLKTSDYVYTQMYLRSKDNMLFSFVTDGWAG